jgi:AcrR family transcriptional regulator
MTEPLDLDTPARILAVAERMFAEQSYRSVSLRSITRESGVNIAAVHYHFGSKHALLERIFDLRCGPMNDERLKRLSECRAERGRPPMLEQVLEAYLRPSLMWPGDDEGARRFLRLRAILAHEDADLSRDLIARHFNDVSRTFLTTLQGLLPALSEDELYWRFHFLLGAHYYTLSNPGRITSLSGGRVDPSHAERSLRFLVPFLAAAFRAEPAEDRLVFGPIQDPAEPVGAA